jgi:selenocysteine lyase/cysteine desulfurase
VDIDALRAQMPGCAGRIHLNNAGAGLLAQPTLDAMTAQLRREAEIGGYEAAAEAQDAIAATYDAIAGLVGGRSGEIRELSHAEQPADAVQRGRDMIVGVRVHATGHRARLIYDGQCHPFHG